jgi:hypothetical protein
MNAEAEKRRRIQSAQNERMKEEREALAEKNRQQNDYLAALKQQQQDNEIQRQRDLQLEQNEPPRANFPFGAAPRAQQLQQQHQQPVEMNQLR